MHAMKCKQSLTTYCYMHKYQDNDSKLKLITMLETLTLTRDLLIGNFATETSLF